jgi:chemotaxis protein methyltransferase CheR
MSGPSLSSTAFETFATLLKSRSGLVIGPDKLYLLETRLAPILKREKLRDLAALADRLRAQLAEPLIRQVVEAMTTNESFFFRDDKPFQHFRAQALPRLLASRSAGAALRVWSAASSSGQEAYSIAMILAECRANIGNRRIEIVGTDLARDQVARAREGLYTQFEVQRGLPVQMLMRYFRKEENGWRISEAIRGMVQYREWNLLADLRPLGQFDVVFCRNVLIYFDQATKARVLDAVARQMPDDGLLYLGGAETVLGITSRFAPLATERGVYGIVGQVKVSPDRAIGPIPQRRIDCGWQLIRSIIADKSGGSAMASTPQLRSLGETLGTEALGIDLSQPLDEATFAWIERAFAEHPVLVFREQDLGAGDLAAFGRRFGVPRMHALIKYRHAEHPEVSWLTNVEDDGKVDWYGVKRATDWHTDSTYEERLPLLAILHAKEVPAEKGGTMFADMRAAYAALPEARKQLLSGLTALHGRSTGPAGERLYGDEKGLTEKAYKEVPWPAVTRHPVTDQPILFVNPMHTHGFAGMSRAEAWPLIEELAEHATQGRFTYYHRWRVGDVLMWDERATMHRGAGDYRPEERRIMLRTIVYPN